jgi:bis(5'-nucleosyl)-tetraphosphatase (symmetrical)
VATYAIGDIQGCYHAFEALLARLKFNPNHDRLWLVGDLINRGSGSLEILRWCYTHQSSVRVVLGNHDLHALAVVHGVKSAHKSDTLKSSIEAPDSEVLYTWLRQQPLVWYEHGYAMLHAGLLPQWTIQTALTLVNEVERVLQGPDYIDFLHHMYGNLPNQWHDALTGYDRLRVITNALTRMRICTAEGEMEFAFKGELPDVPPFYMPWFDVPNRATAEVNIICGHWSALGLRTRNHIFALDTGCLWGGALTAMCLETQVITQVPFDARDRAKT